jgi:hypothetical protein
LHRQRPYPDLLLERLAAVLDFSHVPLKQRDGVIAALGLKELVLELEHTRLQATNVVLSRLLLLLRSLGSLEKLLAVGLRLIRWGR